MLFEIEEIELSEGLETADTMVSVKSGTNHSLKVLSLIIQNML